jgi:hypothetical protein
MPWLIISFAMIVVWVFATTSIANIKCKPVVIRHRSRLQHRK